MTCEETNLLREQIADVIDERLHWNRQSLLEFADKIIAVLPSQISSSKGEVIHIIIEKK